VPVQGGGVEVGFRTPIEVRQPLVIIDSNRFVETKEARPVIEQLTDEAAEFDLHIYITSKEMIPTALVLAMSKRINVNCYAYISTDFEEFDYIAGFLKSGHYERVEFIT
jgi:hypothetical protein